MYTFHTYNLQEFKKLVEDLLYELMAELDITSDQFYEVCEKAQEHPQHQSIVNQITAVDDFIAFKRLMANRNRALNEEALKIMLKREY